MIVGMKKAIVPVLFGIMAGFLATYLLVRDRDMGPLLIRGIADNSTPTAPGEGFEEERAMITELEIRLAQNPQDLTLLSDIANLYFSVQDFPSAIAYYQRAVDISPDDANLITDMGTALYYSDRSGEALAEFERSLELDPAHPQTLFNLGVVLLETEDDIEGAIAAWQRLIDLNPGYAQNAMVQAEIDRLRSPQ
jgi:cytochrome c-type biogenesis protein CcmH/NrfG